jgi:hypothetical protein
MSGRFPSEWVAAFRRNGWPLSVGLRTFINKAFVMLFERYPEPEILESFLGRDLYRLVGELIRTAK